MSGNINEINCNKYGTSRQQFNLFETKNIQEVLTDSINYKEAVKEN